MHVVTNQNLCSFALMLHNAFLQPLVGIQAGKLQQTLNLLDGVNSKGADIYLGMPTGLLSVLHCSKNVRLLHIRSLPVAHHKEKYKLV